MTEKLSLEDFLRELGDDVNVCGQSNPTEPTLTCHKQIGHVVLGYGVANRWHAAWTGDDKNVDTVITWLDDGTVLDVPRRARCGRTRRIRLRRCTCASCQKSRRESEDSG